MSALPPKADMCSHELDVCFVPITDMALPAMGIMISRTEDYYGVNNVTAGLACP
jgi:hypothetical protein